MQRIFIKTHSNGKGFYLTLSQEDIEQYIYNRNVIKHLYRFTYNSLLNLIKLIPGDKCTRTYFEKILKLSISEGKEYSNRKIAYWLRRGYSRKKAKNKLYEVQKDNSLKIYEKYPKDKADELKRPKVSKTREENRKNSVRCVEHWLEKGYSLDEAKEEVRRVSDSGLKKMIDKYGEEEGRRRYEEKIEKMKKNNKICMEYWLERGYDHDIAKEIISKEQEKFSLRVLTEKYGEEEGYKRWKERQEKWQETMNNKSEEEKKEINRKRFPGHNKNYFMSKAEKELAEKLKCNSQLNIENYWYDLYKDNKIIEYNGDYWHCNPKFYNYNYFNESIKMTAEEKWLKDKEKIELARNKGYKVKVVWENDYKNNPERVINECLEFLKEGE